MPPMIHQVARILAPRTARAATLGARWAARWAATGALAAAAALSGCDRRAGDREDLKAVYATMDSGYNASSPAGILDLYTPETFAYYDGLVGIILDGDAARIGELPAPYQYEVLLARLKGSRAEFEGLTGRQYFAHATASGWYAIPRAQRTSGTLGGFEFIDASEAWAQVYTNGDPTGIRFCFIRTEGVWRIDEPRSWRASHEAWARRAAAQGITLEELIVRTLASDAGSDVPGTIWEPMAPAP